LPNNFSGLLDNSPGVPDNLPGQEYKLIRNFIATHAAVHESVLFLNLPPSKAESEREDVETELINRGFHPKICEKGCRNHPLTDEQKENNRLKRSFERFPNKKCIIFTCLRFMLRLQKIR
jgi:hypothetical protein